MPSISLKSSDYGVVHLWAFETALLQQSCYVAQARLELIPPATSTFLSFKLYFIFLRMYTSKHLFSFLPEGSMKTGSCKQHLNGIK